MTINDMLKKLRMFMHTSLDLNPEGTVDIVDVVDIVNVLHTI